MNINISYIKKGNNIIFGIAAVGILFRIINQYYFKKPITPFIQSSMIILGSLLFIGYWWLRILTKKYWKQERERENDFIALLQNTCDSLEMEYEDDELGDLWLLYEPDERIELIEILRKKPKGNRILKEAIIELNNRIDKRGIR